jgi:predicted GNAT family N-acyltransferase
VSGTLQYTVRRLSGAAEMREALALRHEVFCVEQGVPRHEEVDGRDHEGVHLVAVELDDAAAAHYGEPEWRAGGMAAGELLGTCRLLLVGPTVQFSRLAVRSSARRRGIATALLELAELEARAARSSRLVLHAQTYAQLLYERAGYRPRGRVFVEANIEHIAMEKTL